jgi:uncharacterized protein YciI
MLAAWKITMLYVLLGRDSPHSLDARVAARSAHLARLHILQDAGRLIVAGPLPAIDSPDPGNAGFVGSLIVAEFENIAAARAWADSDPYVAAKVYREVEIYPFKKVLP